MEEEQNINYKTEINNDPTIQVKQVVEETKSLFKSKTFWLNVLAIGAGVAGILSQQLEAGTTITLIGFINIVLRVMTKKGIKVN